MNDKLPNLDINVDAQRSAVRSTKWLGLRLAIMALRPWLWLTADVGWLMDEAYYQMSEWRFRLEKTVERMEDEQS